MEKADAFKEAVIFLEHIASLPDPRQAGKVVYSLDEVLLLCLLAVLAGAETIVDIARFGEKKLELLRRFRPFADGTPSHDQLGTILATLDAESFQQCFVSWVAAITGQPAEVIAIDGCPQGDAKRQDVAPHRRQEGRQDAVAYGLRLCRAPASGAWPARCRGEVERDRGHPSTA
jgi:hypothetical protein